MISRPAARALLRLAARDARRHRARSVLVVAMVALPVTGLTAADVMVRTMQLSPAQHLTREIGGAAAKIELVGTRAQQSVGGQDYSSQGSQPAAGSPAAAKALQRVVGLLPAGARLIDMTSSYGSVGAGGRLAAATVNGLDIADPVTDGIVQRLTGAAPRHDNQVALTSHLADRLGVAVGSTVTVAGVGRSVTGVYREPGDLVDDAVYALPGQLHAAQSTSSPTYLVASPQPVTWQQVQALDRIGVVTTSRYVVAHPPARVSYSAGRTDNAETIGILVVVVGLAILEVVLLAGAAFAVGARRQRRDLALVAASGGDAQHVRSVVLGGGLVLGLVGALVGVAAGVGLGRAVIPLIVRLSHSLPGPFDVRPLELAAVAVLGLLTGVAASLLPARTAGRDDVVSALTGRRQLASTPKRVPLVGVAMAVLGALLTAYAAHPPARFSLILAGAVIGELGFVVCAPAVVGLAGRAARFAPLGPRLALRDAARHRGRTGPAVAAIMAAVSGSIAVSTYVVSQVAHDRADYTPQARIGQPVLTLTPQHPADTHRDLATATAVLHRDLAATAVTPLPLADDCASDSCRTATVELAGDGDGQLDTPPSVAVGDATVLRALLGGAAPPAAAVATLDSGGVVAFTPGLVRAGRTIFQLQKGNRQTTASLPASVVAVGARSAAAGAIISPAAARAMRLTVSDDSYLVTVPRVPTQAQQDQVSAALQPVGYQDTDGASIASLQVETGYHPQRWGYGLVALALAAALVTLGATGITTGLSAAESRPDLVTLTAVGGSPRIRRTLVASQAGAVAVLGTVLGTVSGLIPAYGILRTRAGYPVTLPWETIGVCVVGVPLLAMLATAALTSSRVPMTRRLT